MTALVRQLEPVKGVCQDELHRTILVSEGPEGSGERWGNTHCRRHGVEPKRVIIVPQDRTRLLW